MSSNPILLMHVMLSLQIIYTHIQYTSILRTAPVIEIFLLSGIRKILLSWVLYILTLYDAKCSARAQRILAKVSVES